MASKWKRTIHCAIRVVYTTIPSAHASPKPGHLPVLQPLLARLFRTISRARRSTDALVDTYGRNQVACLSTTTTVENDIKRCIGVTLREADTDVSKYKSLGKLFCNHIDLCLENHASTKGHFSFSPFAISLFEKILYIALKKYEENKTWFQLQAAKVYVLHDKKFIVDVVICTSLARVDDDKDFYKDKVIGPFAGMIYAAMRGILSTNCGLYKEITYLLLESRTNILWTSLEDIMTYVLFYTVPQRFVSIMSTRQFLSSGSSRGRTHGLPTFGPKALPGRSNPIFSDSEFELMLGTKEVYTYRFDVTCKGVGEYEVDKVQIHPLPLWTDVFASAFGSHYPFSPKMEIFCRIIIAHFHDTNMDGYAHYLLERQTVKCAVLHLDTEYNISLSTYIALCEFQKNKPSLVEKLYVDLLDIRFKSKK